MSTYLSIVNFVLMQNLITELLINMSQRHCGVERNPTSLLPFEVYLFVQKDITNRSGQNIEGTNADVKHLINQKQRGIVGHTTTYLGPI